MIDEHYVYINELVEKIKLDQKEALHELFNFYKPLILTSIKRCANKEKELYSFYEDLVAESIFVFEKLVKNYDSELSYFHIIYLPGLTILYSIISNQLLFLSILW